MTEKLDDITGLRPVYELSDYYLYMIAAVVAAVLVLLAVFLVYRWLRKPRRDVRGEYIAAYAAIDLDRPKEAAYAITRYARLIAASEREERMAATLEEKLQSYKYAKKVPPLGADVRQHYEIFLGMVNE